MPKPKASLTTPLHQLPAAEGKAMKWIWFCAATLQLWSIRWAYIIPIASIKKENIGLMEVMGLAVLPGRLKEELGGIEASILNDTPLVGDLAKHKEWVENLLQKQMFTPQNTASILKMEIGKSFAQMLEQASVFKRTQKGSAAFDRFIEAVNHRS